MSGRIEDLVPWPVLHDATVLHDRHDVADMPHHGQVVADEQVADAELALQVHEQVQDLALHREVERGDRLVADDELGLQGQGAGDADALELPARERRRSAVAQGRVDAHAGQQLVRPPTPLGPVEAAVDDPWLGHEITRPETRIQGGGGILVDELDVLAHPAQGLTAQCQEVDAAEHGTAGVGLHEPQQDPRGRGLARPGTADETVRLPRLDGEVDVLDGRHDTPAAASPGRERLAQPASVEEEVGHGAPA
jgi:hypothetical protein